MEVYGESGEVFEQVNHCFTVEMWLQSAVTGESPALWRGRVVHIPSGISHYFQCEEEHWFVNVCHGIQVCGKTVDGPCA